MVYGGGVMATQMTKIMIQRRERDPRNEIGRESISPSIHSFIPMPTLHLHCTRVLPREP